MDYNDLVRIKRKRIRVGRGKGGRRGKDAGRGMKGAKHRSGYTPPPLYEGGSLPQHRRVVSLGGFTNINAVVYEVVNVGQLDCFEEGAEIGIQDLVEKGLVRKKGLVKLLGAGEVRHSLTITVDRASAAAIEKVEKAKGKVVLT
ncbi:50S ribosomal protein L15 [bacterium]|nr:50S ribosomal protein L15 [bacterium]